MSPGSSCSSRGDQSDTEDAQGEGGDEHRRDAKGSKCVVTVKGLEPSTSYQFSLYVAVDAAGVAQWTDTSMPCTTLALECGPSPERAVLRPQLPQLRPSGGEALCRSAQLLS